MVSIDVVSRGLEARHDHLLVDHVFLDEVDISGESTGSQMVMTHTLDRTTLQTRRTYCSASFCACAKSCSIALANTGRTSVSISEILNYEDPLGAVGFLQVSFLGVSRVGRSGRRVVRLAPKSEESGQEHT